MISETSPTKNWLKSKLQYIKKNTSLQFSDDVLISILVCLISGDKHLILTCKQENIEELRSMTEQIFYHIFNMTTSTIICDASQTPADFAANLFSRQREDNSHIMNVSNNINPYPNVAEDAMFRLKTQKSTRSIQTISSTKSNDKKLIHDFKGSKRRSNLSHSSNQVSNQIDSYIDSNIADEPQPLYGNSYECTRSFPYENDEFSFQKSKERSRTLDSPRETNFSVSIPSSSYSRKKITNLPTSAQQIDIPEKPSSSRPSLSINTGSPRKNIHSAYHSHLNPLSQSPITPSDYTLSKKKHESLGTGSFEPPSPYFSGSRSLVKAVIIENLPDANEIIYAFLLEILIRKQVIDKTTIHNISKPFIIIVLLPITTMKHNLPNQLLDRFFISYTYEGIGVGKSSAIPIKRSPLIKASEIEELSRKMDSVTIHNDMHRYMRDVVVGIRTHRLVKGGLTARASSDLVILVKALAAVFQRNYATPELVLFASEKIFSHRLILRDAGDDKSIMYGTRLITLLRAKNLAPKFPSPGDVVADVLQAIWPPV
ncbi:hypothetical protein RclHR1_00310015 [Rhizophagus clarus]|uniref:magnesium chelatase n=1 Tax=Rhizophagus clarus TaxID=94130 RepID=A0A2Z6R670_9GLOM|nr:hypothetical protein RclHR1_00310015 [Rhizophagus clarus]